VNEEYKVQKFVTHMPISEELAMEYGLIPDTRPASPPPTWRQRIHERVHRRVVDLRWRLAAKIGGTSREAIEEISGLW